jgi:hypothetical protein
MEFNDQKSREAAADAIAAVSGAASDAWKEEAFQSLKTVARRKKFITTDDVWEDLDLRSIDSPRERRAIVAAINRGAREGVIVKGQGHKSSEIVECHARPKQIWMSLLYREIA